MKRFLLFVITAAMLAGCAVKKTPVLKIAVISDSQAIASENHWGMVNTDKALKFLSSFEPDVLMIPGDLADRKDKRILEIYMDVFRRNFPKKLPVQVICAGNHEYGIKPPVDNDIIWREFADTLNISRDNPSRQTIGGYDFITFTDEDSRGFPGQYSDEKLAGLRKVIDQAVARDNKKPIFLVTHYPPKNTVAGSFSSSGRTNLRKMLNDYPQVISLSGHTHYPLETERAIWQGEFTAITTSTLSYGCIWEERFRNTAGECILPFAREVQQAMMINIFDDHLEIRRYHIGDNNREIKPDKVWTVDIPYNPATARHTVERAKKSVAPQFPADAKMIFRHDFGFAYLIFPPAQHDDMVFCYRMRALVQNDKGKWECVREARYVSDFYRYQRHRTTEVSIKIPEKTIRGGKLMRFEVYPEETFGKLGKPLILDFKMMDNWRMTKDARELYPQE